MTFGTYLLDCLAAFAVCILPAYCLFFAIWRPRR